MLEDAVWSSEGSKSADFKAVKGSCEVKVSVNALEEFGRQEQQGTTIAQKIKTHFDEQHKPCPRAFGSFSTTHDMQVSIFPCTIDDDSILNYSNSI